MHFHFHFCRERETRNENEAEHYVSLTPNYYKFVFYTNKSLSFIDLYVVMIPYFCFGAIFTSDLHHWVHFFLFYEFSNKKWLNVFVVLPSFFYFTMFIVSYTKIFTISSFVCCNGALFLFWSYFHLKFVSLATFFFVLWVFKTEMVKSFCCAAFILFWCHFHLRFASLGTFFFGFEFSNQKWLNVFVVLPSFF